MRISYKQAYFKATLKSEEIIEKLLMQNDQTSKQLLAMLRALELFENNDKITNINVNITVDA